MELAPHGANFKIELLYDFGKRPPENDTVGRGNLN
jgi:hypothetical protein